MCPRSRATSRRGTTNRIWLPASRNLLPALEKGRDGVGIATPSRPLRGRSPPFGGRCAELPAKLMQSLFRRRRASIRLFVLFALVFLVVLQFATAAVAVLPAEMLAEPQLCARARALAPESPSLVF